MSIPHKKSTIDAFDLVELPGTHWRHATGRWRSGHADAFSASDDIESTLEDAVAARPKHYRDGELAALRREADIARNHADAALRALQDMTLALNKSVEDRQAEERAYMARMEALVGALDTPTEIVPSGRVYRESMFSRLRDDD